jgi:hypothetical protein
VRRGVRLQKPGRSKRLAAVLTATLCGFVLGAAIDAAVWLWVFGRALSGEAGVAIPLIVSTSTEHGDVVAQTGVGILVVPLFLALCGLGFGYLIARHPHRSSGTTAEA